MPTPPDSAATDARVLSLTRLLAASPAALYRCWTEPALIVQWFTPPPWKTTRVAVSGSPPMKTLAVA